MDTNTTTETEGVPVYKNHAVRGDGLKQGQPDSCKEGTERVVLGKLLFYLYGYFKRGSIRRFIRFLVLRLESGPASSVTIRNIFATYHDVNVGMYTGRGCFVLGNFKPGTKIGRYTAIYRTVIAFNANHPMNTKSTHAFFYNPKLGYAKTDLLTRTKLTIGNDVWIGHNAIILSSVSSIGDGAIIGAGTVLHQDVPPYAVVAGNPSRVVRYRFSKKIIEELLAERWWEKSIKELQAEFKSFQKPLAGSDQIR
jgi:acetyltransferase-like isoleucine patch superfamily enzyme